ncbi:MAG: penicillin-binding protein 1C [Methylococcaceae bacterium]|nr:penicillin-binding protein 1C [Methylococcaceae bacterium]
MIQSIFVKFKKFLLISVVLIFVIWFFDKLLPISLKSSTQQYAQIIVAEDGTPLRAFADKNGIWRYPVSLEQVSPLYIEALLNYEDRWFWRHFGFNPLALARAALQYIEYKRIISGGSTITMQVARLVIPQKRNILGKVVQILRALQLEWHYSKREILEYYLNHAPFGGTLEGVQAASYVYLSKPALELSHAEAALLAVLPQAPSRNRPDRHPEKARVARDKVIKRLHTLGIWSKQAVDEALIETVYAQRNNSPVLAPLFARRFRRLATADEPLITTIDYAMQQGLEELVSSYIKRLPPKTSAAVLVVENATLAVKTYIGSADFSDNERFGHVDMVTALRSPGSTLKPFLYGLALDEGLIHSESLLSDAPITLNGYRPRNFNRGFIGPVSVSNALKRSLNVPAIQVLHHLGSDKFVSKLKNAGLSLKFNRAAKPNLSVILGGIGTTLESLVGTYTALENEGRAGQLRFLKQQPVQQRYLFSKGAAWIIQQILRADNHRGNNLAWKTGTSYGHRDFWSIGVNHRYTIGVWLGRPDGTPTAGHYGSRTASPLLFEIAERLAYQQQRSVIQTQVASVTEETICWPLGGLLSETPASLCHEKKQAWLLNNTVPKTLPESDSPIWVTNPVTLLVNKQTGRLIDAACDAKKTAMKTIALWPLTVEPWIPPSQHRSQQIGVYDASCKHPPQFQQGEIKIKGLDNFAKLRSAGAAKNLPAVKLESRGAQGLVYWFINGKLFYKVNPNKHLKHQFKKTGRYQIAVSDEMGKTASIMIDVLTSD